MCIRDRITRAKYLDRIIELNGTPDIKIITGIRRSGKSKLMQAYIAYLKSNFENINIIFIDFMDLAYEEIKEYHALHAYVEEHYQEGKTNYLFVDEVQMCPKIELAINSLYSKVKYDIYVTGSNTFLLSADLATLFTGRYIEIHVFPFSFQEYCQFYDDILSLIHILTENKLLTLEDLQERLSSVSEEFEALSGSMKDRKSTRLNSSHVKRSRMPSSA